MFSEQQAVIGPEEQSNIEYVTGFSEISHECETTMLVMEKI